MKVFFRSRSKLSGEHLGRRWEEDYLGIGLPDKISGNKFIPETSPVWG